MPYELISQEKGVYAIKNIESGNVFTLSFEYRKNAKGREVISDFKIKSKSASARTEGGYSNVLNTALGYNFVELPHLKQEKVVMQLQFPLYYLSLTDGFKNNL